MKKASDCIVRVGTQNYGFSSAKKARDFLRRYNSAAKMIGKKPAKLVCS